MAERLGFEPRKELPLCRFSRPVLSTAQPSLRELGFISINIYFNNKIDKLINFDDETLVNLSLGKNSKNFEDNKINNLFKNFKY